MGRDLTGMKISLRISLWLSSIFFLLIACTLYAQVTQSHDSHGGLRTVFSLIIGVSGLSSVFLFPSPAPKNSPSGHSQQSRTARTLLLLILPALAARLLLLPAAPSDDIHRYLWEGKLLTEGLSPYQHTADHELYKEHRDHHWQAMNHKDQPTAYPPLALRCFQLINAVAYSPLSYKIVFLLLDLALIAVLLALLRHYQLPLRWIGLYALSPISLMSYAAEAHFDILMILPFCAALLAYHRGWVWRCGIFLGLAVGMKCMILVAVPFLFLKLPDRPSRLRELITWRSLHLQALCGFILALSLPLLGFWRELDGVLQALFLFGSSRSFNGPSYQLLEWLFGDASRSFANILTMLLYTMVWIRALQYALARDLIASLLWSLGGLVLLSPTVHFWYIAWILPFVCLRPSSFWLTLSLSGALYFLVWQNQTELGVWALPTWARWLFWLPPILSVLSPRLLPSLWQRPIPRKPIDSNPTLSIVIPILNVGSELKRCLSSIPKDHVDEILLIDASESADTAKQYTRELDLDHKPILKHIHKPELKGRGAQIRVGVLAARSDWVIILHADSLLLPEALPALRAAVSAQPSLIGGCLGQRYQRTQPSLLLLEGLNEMRATCFHTSYGDQTQFLHRETAIQCQAVTSQPLMEDIEISQRLSQRGHTAYLGVESRANASKWPQVGFLKRFKSLIWLLLRYHVLTLGSTQRKERLSHTLYAEYYSNEEN